MKGKAITINDLAGKLGVSPATISRALKDHPDISQATKDRVKQLAKELNYRPNHMAQGLRKSRSKVIGVVIPDLVHHFFSSVIAGIMDEAYQRDYRVMLCQSGESYEKEVTDVLTLLDSRVDGLMISLSNQTAQFGHLLEFHEVGLPIVFFDKVGPEEVFPDCPKVMVDDYRGAFEAVSHLVGQGYRRIAHFAGPSQPITSQQRLKGYLDALSHHGIAADPSLIFYCKQVTRAEGEQFVHEMLDAQPDVDALFAVADQVAIGAIVALKARGISIPSDFGVVGFSDWEMATVVEPNLTTVFQPGKEMGKIATQQMIAALEAELVEEATDTQLTTAPLRTILPVNLVVRESSNRHR